MGKLSVFSKKLNKCLEFQVATAGAASTGSGFGEAADKGANILAAWNNNYGSWVDHGWNNNYGSWSDHGWNNNYGSWSDHGWNNNYGSWSDKGWNNNYGSWTDGGGGSSGGGCYISSACTQYKGLPDDCYELQTLRAFRDDICKKDDSIREVVLNYYRKAPLIVKNLNNCEDKNERLELLYNNLVVKCVKLLEEGNVDEAVKTYLDVYANLEKEFLS
jgi:hypothetical protein